MSEKKIGTCIKALINVGNYQNIEVAKYAETTISYDSAEEMVEKENQQTQELLASLKRDLQKTPEELCKYEDSVEAFTDSVSKEMPKWLGEGAIPNIANSAKAVKEKADSKKADELASKADAAQDFEALISDETTPAEKQEVPEENKVEEKTDDLDDIFADDEDLFDD
jgi:hypothetical protein